MSQPPETQTLPPVTTGGQTWGELLSAPAAPTELVERYEELGLLGEGGMGRVLRVLDRDLNRIVAMKVLREGHHGSARFLSEAQIGAQLEHPGILPVYDVGQGPAGRLYFTMREIKGHTLHRVITASHREAQGAWNLRRLVEALCRVGEALAYAHARGVVHRDIKPSNIMVGAFGEILVLDWGIALVRGVQVLIEQPHQPARAAGTKHFMAPEQRDAPETVGPAADVYALGAVLYQCLFGHPPPTGEDLRPLPPPVLFERAASPRWPVPEALRALAIRALSLAPEGRPPGCLAFVESLRRWLDGRERAARGMEMVEQAHILAEQHAALLARAEALRASAAQQAGAISREAVWALEDEAAGLDERAAVADARRLQLLQGALSHDPDLHEAHAQLARHYYQLHAHAESRGDILAARRHEIFLQTHDRGEFADWLSGQGTLHLHTAPPQATVSLAPLVRRGRRLVPGAPTRLGQGPIEGLALERGSYLLTIEAPGRLPLRYPIHLGRSEHWTGTPPGASAPQPVRLLRPGELAADEAHVPAGWFRAGGAPPGVQAFLPPQRVWLDDFVIRRDPITNAQFAAFLGDLIAQGRAEEARRWVPRWLDGGALAGQPVFDLDGDLSPQPDKDGDRWALDWPVIQVSWSAARAYAAWEAERTGLPWRLPWELEWEKAARGVDGRLYPWGDFLDPSWCRMAQTDKALPGPVSIGGFPADTSVYGVRGMGGNVVDWCLDPVPALPAISDDGRALAPSLSSDSAWRSLRGGGWDDAAPRCRSDRRRGMGPQVCHPRVGFRLVRPV